MLEIWVLIRFHMMGVQYHYIAQLVLAVSSLQQTETSIHYQRWTFKKAEKSRQVHLHIIIALARSNSRNENTVFTARHLLSIWIFVLTKERDQEDAKQFLRTIGEKIEMVY